jgi:AraC family transcriptional regulator
VVRDEYVERVNEVMDHVRKHLRDDLSLEALADVAHFSPYHFHRIFKATTGETLAGFRRRSRLERAAYLMKASPAKTLGSVAFDSGFKSQSDFSRVFKAFYGLAPSEWDRVSALAPTVDTSDDTGPGRFGRPDPPIEVVVRRHPPARVAYVRMQDPFRGNTLAKGYERLIDWLDANGVDWKTASLFGISWDNYDSTPVEKVRFDLGFEVPEQIPEDGHFGIVDIPAATSADAHSFGPLLRIAQAWDHLYLEWFPNSGYEPADVPALKRFRRRPDETGWDQWDVDCSIALRRLRR